MILPLSGRVDVDRIVGFLRGADSDAIEYPSNNSSLMHIRWVYLNTVFKLRIWKGKAIFKKGTLDFGGHFG